MKGTWVLFFVLSHALPPLYDWDLFRKRDSCNGSINLCAFRHRKPAYTSQTLLFLCIGAKSISSQVFCSQGDRHGCRAFSAGTPDPTVNFLLRKSWNCVVQPFFGLNASQTLDSFGHLETFQNYLPKEIIPKARCRQRRARSDRCISPSAEGESTSSVPSAFAQPPSQRLTEYCLFEFEPVCRPLPCTPKCTAPRQISVGRYCSQWRRLVARSYRYSKLCGVRALRCPLLNVVDLALMRSPALSAEEVLRQQHRSQAIAMQVRVARMAAKIAVDRERQRKCSAEEVAQVHQRRHPATLTQHLHNYRALLFFTSWDTLSQALIAAVNDLASVLGPQGDTPYVAEGRDMSVQKTHKEKHDSAREVPLNSPSVSKETEAQLKRPLKWTAPGRAHDSSEMEWEAFRKCIPRPDERIRKDEGLRLVLDKTIPAWLPIIGVRVYNSLVLGRGRRAIEKHKRMLTNQKQLRHHERALLLMVNEGILYGAGHLPTLQIWRVEEGLRKLHSVSSKSLVCEEQFESRGPHVANTDVHFMKVFDARGCGPIKLMELAGGNPEPWRVEEALLLERARVSRARRPPKSSATAGILSAGSGAWSSTSCPVEVFRNDISVWLAQLSTLYQYHALSLLLKRLSDAERQFPEYEEFNLRRLRLTRAKRKSFLSDAD